MSADFSGTRIYRYYINYSFLSHSEKKGPYIFHNRLLRSFSICLVVLLSFLSQWFSNCTVPAEFMKKYRFILLPTDILVV